MKKLKIEPALTDGVVALAPYVNRVLRAIAVICDEPNFSKAFVTDESWLSDFTLTREDYPRLSEALGIQLDPSNDDDHVIYRIAAKLKEREHRATS
jgi:hypothetical protein